jgi:hypothetical protein
MSFQTIADLTTDTAFAGRVSACATQQAEIFQNDARPDFVALAGAVMTGQGDVLWTFIRLAAAAPGLADTAGGGGATDQAAISDPDILAAVQSNWPTVAGLYFDSEGQPLGGT